MKTWRIAKQLMPLIFLVLWPFSHFAATNIAKEISWVRLLAIAAIMIFCSLFFTLSTHLFLRRVRLDRLAVFYGIGIVCLFLFDLAVAMPLRYLEIYSIIPIWSVQGPIWLIGTMVVLALVRILSRDVKFTRICTAFAATMIAVSLVQGLITFVSVLTEADSQSNTSYAGANKTLRAAVKRPNVYFIVLDGHPRLDQSKKILGYDFSHFLADLRQREFFVANKSRSNYAMTIYSLSSTLSMDYTLTEGEPLPSSSRKYRRQIHGYNNVVRQFRRFGYYYAHGGDRNYVHCGMAEDMCLELATTGEFISDLERELIHLTPFRLYPAKWPVERFTPKFVAKKLAKISRRPIFVWAHIFSPHDRYFAEDCSTDAELNTENFNLRMTGHDFKGRTIIALRCLHPQIISMTDAILAKDSDAIIILQSDHGPPFLTNWEDENWSREEFDERFSILNAMRLPVSCRHMLSNDMTAVNTFRIIFACLSATEPEMLPDHYFDPGYGSSRPVGMIEWTD